MPDVTSEKLAVTVDEAAAMLGISRSHAWRLIWSGELSSKRLGRRVLVPVRALQRLLDPELQKAS